MSGDDTNVEVEGGIVEGAVVGVEIVEDEIVVELIVEGGGSGVSAGVGSGDPLAAVTPQPATNNAIAQVMGMETRPARCCDSLLSTFLHRHDSIAT